MGLKYDAHQFKRAGNRLNNSQKAFKRYLIRDMEKLARLVERLSRAMAHAVHRSQSFYKLHIDYSSAARFWLVKGESRNYGRTSFRFIFYVPSCYMEWFRNMRLSPRSTIIEAAPLPSM